MISVNEAQSIILQNTIDLKTESVSLENCLGRVLSEDIRADRDFPPFDRVTMDGIAIDHAQFAGGQKTFPLEGRHLAGAPRTSLNDRKNCLEVMTGSILPEGTDTVVRYEDIEIDDQAATITLAEVKHKQNVHRQGTDRKNKDLLIPSLTLITPAEIGVLATVGKKEALVVRAPSIAIISTGDELVDIDQQPLVHQIRKSNVEHLRAALERYHCQVELFHIVDSKEETIKRIREISEQFQVLMLSGGVSKGKADYVPEALESLGYEKLFHRIRQRPGKPFWFGKRDKKVVFAFPGNPVSTFLCYQKYFCPWIEKSLGLKAIKPEYAALSKDFFFKPELTYFLQARVDQEPETGKLLAVPVEGHGSGDHANLLDSEAFLVLPEDRQQFDSGEVFPLIRFK